MPLFVPADGSKADPFIIDDGEAGECLTEPKTLEWHVEIQGTLVRFFRVGGVYKSPQAASRGVCGIWSHQSRMRMLRFLSRIDYERLGPSVFVTLTYPDRVRTTAYSEMTYQRNAWYQAMERYLGVKVAAVWRIEWEERQSGKYTGKLAPHFHLMLFGVRFLPHADAREWWRAIIGAGEGPLATDVKRIKGKEGAGRYLSKYVAKYRSLDVSTYLDSGIKFGRTWGVRRPELIPMMPLRVARKLTDQERDQVRRFAANRWRWYDPDLCGGFTLLGSQYADRFGRWLEKG